ncbi:MAG: hypothetical protein WKF86_05500 [Acidimicrobiales bacterium]
MAIVGSVGCRAASGLDEQLSRATAASTALLPGEVLATAGSA